MPFTQNPLHPQKIYQEAGMCCPMCGEADVSTFEIHHIQAYSKVGRHEEENLILLCSNCHSKVTSGKPAESDVLRLKISLIKGNYPHNNITPNNIIHVQSENAELLEKNATMTKENLDLKSENFDLKRIITELEDPGGFSVGVSYR